MCEVDADKAHKRGPLLIGSNRYRCATSRANERLQLPTRLLQVKQRLYLMQLCDFMHANYDLN